MQSLREYQTFNSINEMDAAAAAHIERHAADLTQTEIDLIRILAAHSCKIPGVSYLKVATICKLLDRSESRVRALTRKLSQLGIIEKIQTYRQKSGGKGVNIIRMMPIQDSGQCAEINNDRSATIGRASSAKTSYDSDGGAAEQSKTIISLKQKSLHNRHEESSDILKGSIPELIYDVMAPYYGASDMYRIYGILLRAKSSIDRNIKLEEWAQEYVQVFKSAVWRLKTGKIRSLEGFLFRSWQSITSWIKRKQAQAAGMGRLKAFSDYLFSN